jgi:hypothetical protein
MLQLLKSFLGKYFVSFLTFLVGIISVFVTPLKDVLIYKFYKEKGSIQIRADFSSLEVGRDLNLLILVNCQSPVPITEGTVSINYNDSGFLVKKGNMLFKTPAIPSSSIFPENDKIVFRAIKAGRFRFYAGLKSKNIEYRDSVEINVLATSNKEKPNKSNISGTWNFGLGYLTGQMILNDYDGNLSGTYVLSNKDEGSIGGQHDGVVLRMIFNNSAGRQKWSILGDWGVNKDFLELKGDGSKLKISGNDWQKADSENFKFYSTHLLPIEQRD